MRAAITALSRGYDDTKRHLLKYAISACLNNSGARTGVISGMLINEVYNAEQQLGREGEVFYVVSVHDHKTGYQSPVTLTEVTFPSSVHQFLTKEGTPFNSSSVSREWSNAWLECGLEETYGPFSPVDNIKHFVSLVLKKFPHLQEKLSKQLKHSKEIERTMYDLFSAAGISVELHEVRKDLDFTPRVIRKPVATVSRCPDSPPKTARPPSSLPGLSTTRVSIPSPSSLPVINTPSRVSLSGRAASPCVTNTPSRVSLSGRAASPCLFVCLFHFTPFPTVFQSYRRVVS
jgi:hypothetical protein